jgi:molybdopterin synthase catalytic subunit
MTTHFELTSTPIDAAHLRSQIEDLDCGAVVTFEGRVRRQNHGRPVDRIVYEAYEPAAIAEGQAVADETVKLHAVARVLIVHRLGTVGLSDLAVWIGVASVHRDVAFTACAFAISALKARVPIWKHEHYTDGGPEWLHPLP